VPGLQEAFDRIGEALERQLPLTHAPGAALAVTDGDEILGAAVRGLANVDRGTPISPHTRFQIASMSKSFAGLVAVQEAAAGRLDLDVSIDEVLPWLEMPEPFGPVTLHHLLTHTGGLVAGADLAPWGIADALHLRQEPPVWAPGSRAHYSNVGWKLVGYALERVTGTPIDALLTERVLQPLGMADSEGGIYDTQRTDAAIGYVPLRTDRPPHLDQPLASGFWQTSVTADGSIVSTVVDMSAYLRMVLAGGAPLLEPDGFARWVGPHADSEDEGFRYGYGWLTGPLGDVPTLSHTGTNIGFNGLMAVRAEDGLAAVMQLNGWGERKAVVAYAFACVGAVLAGTPLPEVPVFPALDAIDGAETYEGVYANERRTWRLTPDDGGLRLEAGPLGVRLQRLDEALIAPHPALERHPIVVERDAAGAVVALGHGPDRYVRDGAPAAPEAPAAWDGLGGAYRGDSPWTPLLRVYARGGRLFLATPAYGVEEELFPHPDGSFAPGEAPTPERLRFEGEIDGMAQAIEWSGARWYRSFES
jgi:CubicO group peptidase (beta-lactamase class C family)